MILSKDMLESFSSQIERLTLDEAEGQRCFSSYQIVSTVFLSHKHEDVLQLKQARRILSSLNAHVYIDWLDKSMPKETSGETAIKLRKKIKESDRFILLATDGAIQSKWCNWELGQGDALSQRVTYEISAVLHLQEYDYRVDYDDQKDELLGQEYVVSVSFLVAISIEN